MMPNIYARLPNELLSAILKYVPKSGKIQVGNDERVSPLESCSMVSWKWRALALKRLFRALLVEDDHPTRNLAAFRSLLESSPHLAACIRMLSLVGVRRTEDRLSKGLTMYPELRHSDLAALVSSMPGLQELGLFWWYLPATPNSSSGVVPRSLRQLRLSGLHSIGPVAHRGLGLVLQLFSSITTLETSSLSSEGDELLCEKYYPRHILGVQMLNAYVDTHDCPSTQLPVLELSGVFSTMSELWISPTSMEDVESAAAFIPASSPVLRTVVLKLSSIDYWFDSTDQGESKTAIDTLRTKLVGCEALHCLTLFLAPLKFSRRRASHKLLLWLTSLSQTLQHLSIVVQADFGKTVASRALPWAEVFAIHKGLSGLKSIDIAIEEWDVQPVARLTNDSALEEQLQELRKKGVLRFRRVRSWDVCTCGP